MWDSKTFDLPKLEFQRCYPDHTKLSIGNPVLSIFRHNTSANYACHKLYNRLRIIIMKCGQRNSLNIRADQPVNTIVMVTH